VAVAAFIYAASALLACPGSMAAGESLYHFGLARRIWAGDLAPDPSRSFPWTIYRKWPVDHYWLFHVVTAPFAVFHDRELGMKIAAAFLFAVFLVVLTRVIARRGAPLPCVWAFASVLFSSQDWRYLQLRGGVTMATLALVFAEVAFFVDDDRRRRLLLVALGAIALLSYNGAVVLIPLHLAGVVGLAFTTGDDRRELARRAFEPLLTIAGLALGLLVNPYMDRHASTFRFAYFHVRNMAADSEGLFAGRENVEFNPFPFEILGSEWGWIVFFAAVTGALAFVAHRRIRLHCVSRDEVVYGAITVALTALMLRAVRMREYGVPFAFVFFAVVARPFVVQRLRRPRLVGLVAVIGLLIAGAHQWNKTIERIPRVHPPIDLFAGARPVLEEHAGVPVANLMQGDASQLLWEWPDVQAAQALSPYFLYYDDRALYDDLRALRDIPSDDAAIAALARLRARGCRLVTARADQAFLAFAARHPELVRLVWEHPEDKSQIYEIA
jgi:hypothetical protein